MHSGIVFCVVTFGRGVLRLCTRGRVEGQEHLPAGGVLLAANHTHFFDSGLIIGASPRYVRWLSILPVGRGLTGKLLQWLGLIPFRRGGRDAQAMRMVVDCLKQGDVVGIFPEGGIRSGAEAITGGAPLDAGICRLSSVAGVPVVPCVCVGAEQFSRVRTWFPFSGAKWAVVFGAAVPPGPEQHALLNAAFPVLYRRAVELRG